MRRVAYGIACLAMAVALPCHALTALKFESSPTSYVGQGESVYVTAEDGFLFEASVNYYKAVNFNINNWATDPDNYQYWSLSFVQEGGMSLTPGTYTNAIGYPLHPILGTQMDFSGNGRGNNTLLGEFTVLEAKYNSWGELTSFAVDFVQYDGGDPNDWATGQLRYNSLVPLTPVPEPSSAAMCMIGSLILLVRQRRRSSSINLNSENPPMHL